jgi:pimeloyl-ACP methyl ester carboxylesterase
MTLKALESSGDKKGVRKVEKIGPDKSRWSQEDFNKMNKLMTENMPNVPNMITDLKIPSMSSSPDHSIWDIIDIFNGMTFSLDMLYDELIAFDAHKLGLDFDLPFFILHGDSDIITPTSVAKEYFDEVKAPHKEFALIKKAGHLAAFAQPEQFLDELIHRVRPLAK